MEEIGGRSAVARRSDRRGMGKRDWVRETQKERQSVSGTPVVRLKDFLLILPLNHFAPFHVWPSLMFSRRVHLLVMRRASGRKKDEIWEREREREREREKSDAPHTVHVKNRQIRTRFVCVGVCQMRKEKSCCCCPVLCASLSSPLLTHLLAPHPRINRSGEKGTGKTGSRCIFKSIF